MLPTGTKTLLEKVIVEVQKEENMTKVKGKIVNPLFCKGKGFIFFFLNKK